ncbi:hypothetical protein CAEBREN_02439 [Caenorhabditis brenneri]|uniref:DUF19 domain-containing protein n=1 Tax=Caenorhabditis brenneri TaxID=135651 RepID=G0M9X9_CAEBE|nr:hypothetical protein CAEBREN_02439 [Caenorhabditis brenneri]
MCQTLVTGLRTALKLSSALGLKDRRKCMMLFVKILYFKSITCLIVSQHSMLMCIMGLTTVQKILIFPRRVAYTNGKSCFLEIAQKNCSEPAMSYLNSNYKTFLKFMTASTAYGACNSWHDELMARQCEPLTLPFADELKLWQRNRILKIKSDSNISIMCKDVEECMSNYCYFDKYRKDFAWLCEEVRKPIENPKTYDGCYIRIASKLDYSKYKCIKEKQIDLDPFMFVIEKLKPFLKDKECARTVMEGECEPLALENFDVEWEKMRKIEMEFKLD